MTIDHTSSGSTGAAGAGSLSVSTLLSAAALLLVSGSFFYTRAQLEAQREDVARLRELAPRISDLMRRVQDHAARAWAAGKAQNWALVDHSLREIEAGMDRAAVVQPVYGGVAVAPLFASFKKLQISALDAAWKSKDAAAFDRAYSGMVAACNACHAQVGSAYVVITEPTGVPVTNQNFAGSRVTP